MNEALADLQDQFPGWQIWYVPRAVGGAIWCARPEGKTSPVLNEDSPERLAALIARQDFPAG
jgi:hypothetical protein